MARPDLNTIRTNYQVADDQMIDYRPRVFGAIDIPASQYQTMLRQAIQKGCEFVDGEAEE